MSLFKLPAGAPGADEALAHFASMAEQALQSSNAQVFMLQLQARLVRALGAAGLTTGQWAVRMGRAGDGSLQRSIRVTDPLGGDVCDMLLRLVVTDVVAGCTLSAKVEVRNIMTGAIFATCNPLLLSWPERHLGKLSDILHQAFADLARDGAAWDGEHFELLAQTVSTAGKP